MSSKYKGRKVRESLEIPPQPRNKKILLYFSTLTMA